MTVDGEPGGRRPHWTALTPSPTSPGLSSASNLTQPGSFSRHAAQAAAFAACQPCIAVGGRGASLPLPPWPDACRGDPGQGRPGRDHVGVALAVAGAVHLLCSAELRGRLVVVRAPGRRHRAGSPVVALAPEQHDCGRAARRRSQDQRH
jgi:hypothetical protein